MVGAAVKRMNHSSIFYSPVLRNLGKTTLAHILGHELGGMSE